VPGRYILFVQWSARTAVAAAMVLLSSAVTASAQAADEPLTCDYRLTQWRGGFSADLTIHNAGPAIDGWTAAWTWATPTVNQGIWSAQLVSESPTAIAFSNAVWNGRVPTGGATTFGWTARALSTTVPSDITVNGVPCPVRG
jgi:hypothetical protein